MFAPDGIFPMATLRGWHDDPSVWSACFLDEAAGWQALVLAAEGLAGLALALGWQTRLATAVAWVAVVSVIRRTAPAANAGDNLLAALLCWGFFLPLGDAWSLDARRRPKTPGWECPPQNAPARNTCVMAAPLVLQIAAVYLGAGIAKCNASWLSGGAVADALSVHDHGTWAGEWLGSIPGLPRFLTWAVLALELVGPLILVAMPTTAIRAALVLAFAVFHLGIAACMSVGLFAPIGLAAWSAFIPSAVWDRISPRLQPRIAPCVSGLLPPPAIPRASLRSAPLVVVPWFFAVVAGLAWLYESGPLVHRAMPRPIAAVANLANLSQRWQMFGEVKRQRQWVQARAVLQDGSVVDVLRGGRPVGLGSPAGGFTSLPHHRWHKLFWELPSARSRPFAPPVAEALARDWNARHAPERRVRSLELRFALTPIVHSDGSIDTLHEAVLATWPDRGAHGAGGLDRLLDTLEPPTAVPKTAP